MDIVIACSEIASSVNAHGDVRATSYVAKARRFTAGCVVAGCIARERVHALGRVPVTGVVVTKGIKAIGRVEVACGVAEERIKTVGGVVATASVASERINPAGSVVAAGGCC